MNPDWDRIGLESFESMIRSLIGRVVAPEAIGELAATVREVTADTASVRASAMEARDRMIFNVGGSSAAAAAYLASFESSG